MTEGKTTKQHDMTRQEILKQFKADRTEAISRMLDNPRENGIFKTTYCYNFLDEAFLKALDSVEKQQPYISEANLLEIIKWYINEMPLVHDAQGIYEAFSEKFPHFTTPQKEKSEIPTNLVSEQERSSRVIPHPATFLLQAIVSKEQDKLYPSFGELNANHVEDVASIMEDYSVKLVQSTLERLAAGEDIYIFGKTYRAKPQEGKG